MHIQTKIICTIGPVSESKEMLLKLIDAGMNVARINFSHGNQDEHLITINNIKEVRKEAKQPIAIMLDTKGPEIRVGKVKDDILHLEPKQKVRLVRSEIKNDTDIPIHPFEVLDVLKPTQKILFDDGYIIAKVLEKEKDAVLVEIQNSGVLKSSKSINIPNVTLPLPAVTEQDILDLIFGCENDIDIVAASFIRSADHVLEIKKILNEHSKADIPIIAKIESSEGVENFDEIADAADGIMIARGDLGVEVDLSLVPKLQKSMIAKCYEAAKPVVVATQMLESMINNPRPTRAEVSDVANAIYDSASCVMLSAESAAGKYPIETVQQMKKIVYQAEQDFDYKDFFYKESRIECEDVSSSVAVAAVKTAYSAGAKAIFAITRTGFTTRLLTRLRPNIPIIALTKNEKKYHQLSFLWGVIPIYSPEWSKEREAFAIMSHYAMDREFIAFGDFVVLISSFPFDKRGITNLMLVESVGEVLVRGFKGHGNKVKGKIAKIIAVNGDSLTKAKDKIIVISKCSESYLPLFEVAKAVILQNRNIDTISEKLALEKAQKLDLPLVIRAKHANDILLDDEVVHLDPQKGLVFKVSEDELL
ncbi:MAG: Pyruvate kinase [Candidatus Anoxychlamydiales bacterium]|uniref:pyruvate kinase n=1 Tax=marine sediment metagenome TaxID=412755 RepID=A0A0F9MQ61_9ZZZZ|nr:Pyruvate kinase [Candidatus Anoxychlamydiales bacterium]HEU64524.1 pyruvate kinase [Chlamydiota bacterium]